MPELIEPTEYHPKKQRNVSPEALARFLEVLSTDTEEAGQRYTLLHRKLVGFLNMKGVPDPMSTADEVIDRAVLKIADNTRVSDVSHYCLGIARNVAKEKLRGLRRENSAFMSFIESLADTSEEQIERISRVLKYCFEQLTLEEQNLLSSYCQIFRGQARAEHRRQLAATRKTTVLALRMRVARLRGVLTNCVEKRSTDNPAVL